MDGAAAGGSKKSTVYVAGFAPEVNEQELLSAFVTFGDILEISIPPDAHDAKKHRGYAFLTFANPADAQDAVDNFDLNELPGYAGQGKFLKCSLAQPDRHGNSDGKKNGFDRAVWESEDWIKKYANSGGAEGQDGEPEAPNGVEADE